MPLITIVVPIFNEESVIPEFYSRLSGVLDGLGHMYAGEIIFVNDGSSDVSLMLLHRIAASDTRVRVVNLSRNFGHQLAITCGIDHASGDAVVVMDGDLQDPPEVIGDLVAAWRAGAKIVHAVRTRRKGECFSKKVTAAIYYRIIRCLSSADLPLDSGDFRLMDRQVVAVLATLREGKRYIRGMVSWVGFCQAKVPYERDARYSGTTKYSFARQVRLAFDGISSFSDIPLHMAGYLGFFVTIVSFLYAIWLLTMKILDPSASIQGWTSLMLAIIFFGGVQLIALGILGQYVGRIYGEARNRPLYVVESEFGGTDEGI